MDSVSRRSMIWSFVGSTPVLFFIVTAGFYMSLDWAYKGYHTIIILIALTIYTIETIKPYGTLRKLLPIFVALVAHFGLTSLEKGEWLFTPGIFYMVLVYGIYALFGGIFIPMYYHKIKKSKIKDHGVDAMAIVENAWDMGARLTENKVYKSYKMKLELRIEGHPKSPYTVTDTFWVSEFYIHRLTSSGPIPVKVSKKNHKKIALNLTRSE